MYITVERMDGCEYSIKIVLAPLKERIAGTNFFLRNKHTTDKRIAQTKDDCKFSCQDNYITIQRMDDCHSFHDKKDTLLEGMDGCNYSGEISRLPLKKSKIR